MKIKPYAALLTAAVMPCTAVYAADSTKIGYGQGTATDEKNRPVDAVQFNSRYGDLDAFALSEDEKRIIITFDQGYENGYTAKILDTLKEKDVQAIFFLTGPYAKTESALVQRMIDEGHVLGNHGMTHASLPTLSDENAKEEIMSLHNYVMNNYGYQMQYFRCPCGEYSEKALETAQQCGYKTLFWSSAYVDWKTDQQPSPQEGLRKLTEAAHGGEILLLHSVSSTNAEILGELIDSFRAMGYTV
ncbi:polysaccharide deacetylase family protein [Ruminococcus flavefaciens]|uniref:Peptidoglycan-N-acetylmuramic acid deacetylase n=1 Tax=Ruminococcus flavefaciens TaxID=1265 RepID=A0A315XXU2_RUMFL|nr:polysaccharide deacetylase family protein [Ruminococcus flavefaciens]PWJ12331.1 peptidoglycan-N-acetylmuramic acid deacetylase [Ruminococcus flavefaciens]SSA49821.1 peptidoglycan-N-acetylmuramic acid deacetylase [Ruminococcus flavefaciens]